MYFEFMNKTKICAGKNALEQLNYECQQFHMQHPLILTDQTLFQLKYVDLIKKYLDFPFSLYTDIPVDSSIYVVEDIKDFYMREHCDGLIALGGGSVLDTAKGVYLMLSQECDTIEDILGFEDLRKGLAIPFFAMPSTAGTGSEATCVAVINNPKNHVKMEIISQHIQSDVAFIDPRLTQNLPLKTTVSTAIDALVHAIEAYTCSARNPISDIYALSAMKMIIENLPIIVKKPKDLDIRSQLALASYLAGVAFSNSMVGIVHAIGHALGAVCHVPHGDAMSMLLIPCMRYNKDVNKERYGELLMYINQDLYAQTPKEALADTTIQFLSELLNTLHQKVQLPISLQSLDISKDIHVISEKALNDGALLVNEKYTYLKDIEDILGGHYGY